MIAIQKNETNPYIVSVVDQSGKNHGVNNGILPSSVAGSSGSDGFYDRLFRALSPVVD